MDRGLRARDAAAVRSEGGGQLREPAPALAEGGALAGGGRRRGWRVAGNLHEGAGWWRGGADDVRAGVRQGAGHRSQLVILSRFACCPSR